MSRIIIIGRGRDVDAEYVGLSASVSNHNSLLEEDFDFGDAESGLKIVLIVHFYAFPGANPQITGGTIGGASISTIKAVTMSSGTIDLACWIVGADLPGGGVGDISLSFSDNVYCKLAVYRVINNISLTPNDTGQNTWASTTSSPKSADADVLDGGAFFGGFTVRKNSGSPPVSGITPDYQTSITADTDYRIVGGFLEMAAAATGTITVGNSGAPSTWDGAIAAAGLR